MFRYENLNNNFKYKLLHMHCKKYMMVFIMREKNRGFTYLIERCFASINYICQNLTKHPTVCHFTLTYEYSLHISLFFIRRSNLYHTNLIQAIWTKRNPNLLFNLHLNETTKIFKFFFIYPKKIVTWYSYL